MQKLFEEFQSESMSEDTEIRQKSEDRSPCGPRMALTCLAFWLFGGLFGFIALVLEVLGRRAQQRADSNSVRQGEQLRKAAYVLSIAGIIIGWLVLVIVIATLCSHSGHTKSSVSDSAVHDNQSLAVNTSRFCTDGGQCYRLKSYGYSCASCLAIGGTFSNLYCYHNSDNCTYGFSIEGHCFASRRLSTECDDGEYLGNDGYCYYTDVPDCGGGFHVNCACYKYNATTFHYRTCVNIKGFFEANTTYGSYSFPADTMGGVCFYNSFNCSGYSINGQCYANRTTKFTEWTCKNIKGFMENGTCYSHGYNCPYSAVAGQCYRLAISVHRYPIRQDNSRCTSCINTGGFFKDNMCYYAEEVSFPSARYVKCNYYKIDDRCERLNISLNYSQCMHLGGAYNSRDGSCFYTEIKCPNFTADCRCYNYMSKEFNAGTCRNIGGGYDVSQITCYYNSSDCPYYKYKNQCYSSRTRQKIPSYGCDGAYDSFNEMCYSNGRFSSFRPTFGPMPIGPYVP